MGRSLLVYRHPRPVAPAWVLGEARAMRPKTEAEPTTTDARRARPRRRATGDAGTALVELGLVMPLIAALALGMVSTGISLHQRIELNHVSREAARYGATLPSSQTFANGETWADNIEDLLVARSSGLLSVPGATICVSLVEGSGVGGVYVVSGPYAPAAYSSRTDAKPCDPTETYPTTLYDLGRRVQIRITRPANIETGLSSWKITLYANTTVKSESSS